MKPYGVKKKDMGCCPGHDKYDKDGYKIETTRSKKRRLRPAKKSARQEGKKYGKTN